MANSSAKTVIFSAPQGWGKTLHAHKLMQQHGCTQVVDDWMPGKPMVPGALHLTHARPHTLPNPQTTGGKWKNVCHGWGAA